MPAVSATGNAVGVSSSPGVLAVRTFAAPGMNHTQTPQFIKYRVDELRPHPSYVSHQLSVPTFKLTVLAQLGDLAFQNPIAVTQERLIIDGYARLELARSQGLTTLQCLEYQLTQDEALCYLIQKHRRSDGLNDFTRIELALDLESFFREKARVHQQDAGRRKGSSMLTEAERVDSRKAIAQLVGVSVGNVSKVKHILAHACSSLQQAVRTRELSINLADKWSHEPDARQREYLRLLRIERGIRRKARHLVAAELAHVARAKPDEQTIRLSDFVTLVSRLTTIAPERSKEFDCIEVKLVDGPGRAIFVTEELFRALTPQQEMLVR